MTAWGSAEKAFHPEPFSSTFSCLLLNNLQSHYATYQISTVDGEVLGRLPASTELGWLSLVNLRTSHFQL